MIYVGVVLFVCVVYGLGYLSGKFAERQAWNKLIDGGRLPKPSPKGTPRSTGWYEH